jgi:hypothetical protein
MVYIFTSHFLLLFVHLLNLLIFFIVVIKKRLLLIKNSTSTRQQCSNFCCSPSVCVGHQHDLFSNSKIIFFNLLKQSMNKL